MNPGACRTAHYFHPPLSSPHSAGLVAVKRRARAHVSGMYICNDAYSWCHIVIVVVAMWYHGHAGCHGAAVRWALGCACGYCRFTLGRLIPHNSGIVALTCRSGPRPAAQACVLSKIRFLSLHSAMLAHYTSTRLLPMVSMRCSAPSASHEHNRLRTNDALLTLGGCRTTHG